MAVGQPIPKPAHQVGDFDLQAAVAKLTYQEGCAALYESAKEHLGVRKVHAICEAMVHAFFFRGRSFKNGKDWLDTIGSEKLRGIIVLDTIRFEQFKSKCAFVPDGRMEGALRMAVDIAELAGISTADLSTFMENYRDLISREMKQRGFLFSSQFLAKHETFFAEFSGMPAWQLVRVD